tara:strand:+ start:159 stop:692 length:534 start_codon:yes stop_codon:yes gene_type:complete
MSAQYRGFDPESDSGRNYGSGTWGGGSMSLDDLAKAYGLDRSKQGTGEGHIYGRNAEGQDVYLGYADSGLMSNQDLISAHSKQANLNEVDHLSADEKLSSMGDLRGALLTQWDGSGGSAADSEPEIERLPKKEASPDSSIQQARERVANFRKDTNKRIDSYYPLSQYEKTQKLMRSV